MRLWVVAGALGIAAGFMVLASAPIRTSANTALGWALLVFSPLIAFAGLRFHRTRIRRRAEAADLALCERCLYDLRGLGEVGTCPECGMGFSLDTTRFIWRLWIDEIGKS